MSQAEDEFAFQLKAARITGWVREHKFDLVQHACDDCGGSGKVPGKRQALIRCTRCNSTGVLKCGRKWALDFAWPKEKIAIEVEGGVHIKGRHTRGPAFEKDCVKYATAAMAGFTVVRVTPRHVKSGEALRWAESLLTKN